MNAKKVEKTEDEFCEYVTSVYGSVGIFDEYYYAGDVLKEMNPDRYEKERQSYFNDCEDRWFCERCDVEYDTEEEAEKCCKDKFKTELEAL